MRHHIHLAVVAGLALAIGPWACSPSTGGNALNGNGAGAQGAGASGSDPDPARPTARARMATAAPPVAAPASTSAASERGKLLGNKDGSTACTGTAEGAEQIFVDATVTDTITTYSPVALYIMLDRSGSMVTGFPTGTAQSWPNATSALTAFVNDPSSQTLDVGLGFFPPLTGAGDCPGTQCEIPAVDIGPAPQTGPQIISAMKNDAPQALNFTPTECALRGMEAECEDYMKKASGEPCVVVFITDGDPDQCDGNTTDLAAIVASGLTAGVKTFTIKLDGVSDPTFLDSLAQAGGTGQAIDVSANGTSAAGATDIINALKTIRQKTTTSSSHQVTRTVTKPLDCQWTIPPAPPGQTLNPNEVNLTLSSNGTTSTFGHLSPAAGAAAVNPAVDCNSVTGNAWYYSPTEANPTEIFVCPQTCTTLKADTGGIVNIQFGCQTAQILH